MMTDSNKTQTMHPLLDADKQHRAQQYETEKRALGIVNSIISLVFLTLFYFSEFSHWLAYFIHQSVIWTVIFYAVIFILIYTIVGLPFNWITSYRHEHKWDFSNHTPKSWWADELKSLLVTLILMPLLLGLLLWIMATWQNDWWWIAALAMALVGTVFATLFPVVILPLFNKYDPIDDKDLTDPLRDILTQAGLKASGFFRQDMSKQTKKENAFLAGLGKTRRVVLADNLLTHMSLPEIKSVIAHEVGHYQHKHIWKNIVIGTLQQLIIFFLLHRIMSLLSPDYLSSTRRTLALLPIILMGMGLLAGMLFGILNGAISRYFERQADRSSLKLFPDKKSFQMAMAGLANRNLSNAYPKWWIKWLYYSHPPIGERLEFAERY